MNTENNGPVALLEKIATKKECKNPGLIGDLMYFSKIDNSYLCHDIENVLWMFNKGITEQVQNSRNDERCTSNIGYNPVEKKWYGWSHRAVFGFGIGSKVKKGDCAFKPRNEEEFLEQSIKFWSDEDHEDISGMIVEKSPGKLVAQITWKYSDKILNKNLRGTIGETICYPPSEWGKGEWTAETMEDAKQMAKDFAESVS